MIILKKDNHFEHTNSVEKAQEMVNSGFEVIKNSFGGDKIVKNNAKKAAPKKKIFAKKKK
jgi:hypothetical protein